MQLQLKIYELKPIKDLVLKEYHNLIDDYKKMDINHGSPYLDSMEEAIKYLAIYLTFRDKLDIKSITKIIHNFYVREKCLCYSDATVMLR